MTGNIYAPFSLSLHLTFCIIATIFYAYMYVTKKHSYYFNLILAFDLTLITQFVRDRIVIYSLGVAEIILLVLIFISMYRVSKAKKKAAAGSHKLLDSKKENVINDAFNKEEF